MDHMNKVIIILPLLLEPELTEHGCSGKTEVERRILLGKSPVVSMSPYIPTDGLKHD